MGAPARVLAGVGRGALAILAGLLLCGASALAYVRTPWGASRLAALVETQLNRRIAGEVHLAELTFTGPLTLRMRHVLILDAAGYPVISADEVTLVMHPAGLLAGTARIEELRITGGRLEVAATPGPEGGLTISRVFRPRNPRPEEPGAPRRPARPLPPHPPFTIDLRHLALENVAYRQAPAPGAPPLVLVSHIDATAAGTWDATGARATLSLRGDARVPLEGPLTVDVDAAFAGNLLRTEAVRATIGDTSLVASGISHMRTLAGTMELQGTIGPEQARFVGVPLARRTSYAGTVEFSRDRVATGLELWVPGAGHVVVRGAMRPRTTGLRAEARLVDVSPGAWIEGAPAGEIGGLVTASGSIAPRRLELVARLERGELAGEAAGPARMSGLIDGDRFRLDEARVVLPGAVLSAGGSAGGDGLDLRATLRAADLARASRFVARVSGLGAPLPLGGRGTARVHVTGPPSSPRVAYDLTFFELRWGAVSTTGVNLTGELAPGEDGLPHGFATGSVDGLATGRLHARELVLSAARDENGHFTLEARGLTSVAGRSMGRSTILAEGALRRERVEVERMTFVYPEGRLLLRGPATIGWDDAGPSVDGLDLEGPGQLRISGSLRAGELQANVRAEDLRLDRLPQALLPFDATGRVDVDATLRGTVQAPSGHVRFHLRDASLAGLRDLAVEGVVDLGGGRAAGEIRAALGGTGVLRASFDVPVAPQQAPPSSPVQLDVSAGPVDLAGLSRALDVGLPSGTVRAVLRASGPIGGPDVTLRAQVEDLRPPGTGPVPPVNLHLSARIRRGLATVDGDAWSGDARLLQVHATAPLDLRRLRASPAGEVRRMLASPRSRAAAEVRGLDLAQLGALAGLPDLRGAAAAAIDLSGPIRDPRGSVQVELRGGPVGPLRTVLAAVEADLAANRTRLAVLFAPGGEPASRLVLTAGAALRAILDGAAPASTPVALALDVPAMRLGPLLAGGEKAESRGPPALAGTVSATGHLEGTLGRLAGQLRAIGTGLLVSGDPVGDVELRVEQGTQAVVHLAAIDPRSGTLQGRLATARPISPLAVLRRGFAALHVPAELQVQARGLSLSPLAITTAILRASGRLDLDVRARGDLLALRPEGSLSVSGGRVEMLGGTVYDRVRVDARLTGESFDLQRVEARTPTGGGLWASGRLVRTHRAPDPFSLDVRADRFPIAGTGGVVARVSASGRLTGTSSLGGIQGDLDVQRARIELPESSRELQNVDRPDEFVMISGPDAERREATARAREAERLFPVSLHVSAPRRVFVVGGDVEAELTGDLTLRRGRSGEINAVGAVESRRGQVKVLGRTFAVEDARATFTGGEVQNPRLSVTVRYDTPAVKAWVDVAGTARRPEITLRSNPPLPESEIALLIATGRTTLSGQTGGIVASPSEQERTVASTAASVAGSYAADRLRQALGPKLPLDVLTLQTGGASTRLEAGKYLSDRFYLGYSWELGTTTEGTNISEVRAEYEIGRDVSLQSRYGDQGSGGLDLVWEKTLPTARQNEARRQARREAAAREEEPPVEKPPDEG